MAAADRLLLLQKIDQVALLIGMEQLVYWKQIAFNYDKKNGMLTATIGGMASRVPLYSSRLLKIAKFQN